MHLRSARPRGQSARACRLQNDPADEMTGAGFRSRRAAPKASSTPLRLFELPQLLNYPSGGSDALILVVDVDEDVQLERALDQGVHLRRDLRDLRVTVLVVEALGRLAQTLRCPSRSIAPVQ